MTAQWYQPNLMHRAPTNPWRVDQHRMERAHKRPGVLLQYVAIDVLDRVAGLVIARIKRPPCRAAEQARLFLRLRTACAGVKPDRRDALLGKGGVVAAESGAGALLDVQPVLAKLGDEFAPRHRGRSIVGRSRALEVAHE